MYSRSNGRDSRWYDPDEGYADGMDEDEYELYRYNLPPRYDGNRFGVSRSKVSKTDRREVERESFVTVEESVEHDNINNVCDDSDDDRIIPYDGSSSHIPKRENEMYVNRKTDFSAVRGLLPELGREEILIIALILIISAEREVDVATVLLLLILLTVQ